MKEKKEYHFTEQEVKQWLLGFDAEIHLRIFLEGEKDEWSKEYLIKVLLESYQARMNQKISGFEAVD
jgi:hypothetical protein